MSAPGISLHRADDLAISPSILAGLLAPALGAPMPETVQTVIRGYAEQGDLQVAVMAGEPVGIIGLRRRPEGTTEIRHIAVLKRCRRQGVGRFMVQEMVRQDPHATLVAETDADAVEFYRRLGFQVSSLGEKYPGVERFLCVWRRHDAFGR